MPRPYKCRFINADPQFLCFKPRGVPMDGLEIVELGLDEMEAIRLIDFGGLYQTDAAQQMGISQATIGRLLERAHKKIADALINGKTLLIKGGKTMYRERTFLCDHCNKEFKEPCGNGRPDTCPHCGSKQFHRSDPGEGFGTHRGDCHAFRGGTILADNETPIEQEEGKQ